MQRFLMVVRTVDRASAARATHRDVSMPAVRCTVAVGGAAGALVAEPCGVAARVVTKCRSASFLAVVDVTRQHRVSVDYDTSEHR